MSLFKFNKSIIHRWIGLIVLFILFSLLTGFVVWQVKLFENEIKIEEIKSPPRVSQKENISNGDEFIEAEIIRPIILKMDKWGDEVLIANREFCNDCINSGKQCKICFKKVAFYFELREDLNGDRIEEIIIGLGARGVEEPSIVLLSNVEGRYKVIDRVATLLNIEEINLKRAPNDQYWSIIAKVGGGMGAGISGERILVYTYLNNRLKLTWQGDLLIEVVNPPSIEEKSVYRISFVDIDSDGNVEINQRGLEWKKEIKWNEEKGEFGLPKETTVLIDKYFKWNPNSEQFEEMFQK